MPFHIINGRLFEERDGAYHPVNGLEAIPVADYAQPAGGVQPVTAAGHVLQQTSQLDMGLSAASRWYDDGDEDHREHSANGVSDQPHNGHETPPLLPQFQRNPTPPRALRWLAGAPRLPRNQTADTRTGRDIVISRRNAPRLEGAPNSGNSTTGMFNSKADYSRGDGFNNDEWDRFNRNQQEAANDMSKKVEKLIAKADQLDKKGQDGGDLLREGAKYLLANAVNLRDTSPNAPKAHLSHDDDAYFARRAQERYVDQPDSQAFTTRDNRNTYFRPGDLGVLGDKDKARQIIMHDGFHTIGLEDQRGLNGAYAYRDGGPQQYRAFNSIRGTRREVTNPDSLTSWVYPRSAFQ